MSNLKLIIEERPANIGNFMVGRLLPFREKRTVGPFAFIDHMGPVKMAPDENLDIAPHPHIGLSTLTYLFEGAIYHKDSLGNQMEIKPGAVNWMTAGKGIVHSERTPDHLRGREKSVHGLQIWVALPKHLEEIEPSFYHAAQEDLPTWNEAGLGFKLIAGELAGHKSPVPVYSPLYLIEIRSTVSQRINLGQQLFGESAIYILEGSIESEGNTFGSRQIMVAKDTSLCDFILLENSVILVFGGEPFKEERFIYWNFVSSDPLRIEAAKKNWQERKFPPVPGELDFVPLPEQQKNDKKS